MEIYKFGGASVRDAASVQNVAEVVLKTGIEDKVIVVSAMGKMTNAFELVVAGYLENDSIPQRELSYVKEYHYTIASDLFEDSNHAVFKEITALFEELENFMEHNKSTQYDFVYDQIVCFGELLSTKIVSAYFVEKGIEHKWLDARDLIKTDSTFRDATVNWSATQRNIQTGIKSNKLYLTQGFIGADDNNFSTTLGREGSDYTAAIFAYCLNAIKVTIWKDVPGVLNADPRVFENSRLLNQISYEEAIELAFFGASVIHPKTLQPL